MCGVVFIQYFLLIKNDLIFFKLIFSISVFTLMYLCFPEIILLFLFNGKMLCL